MQKISFIFPCYNEEQGIPNLVAQLTPVVKELEQNYTVELIFVDDGSKDNTYATLQQYYGNNPHAKIVKHSVNKNLGGALKTGFAHATGDLIATFDSDCTYSPTLIFPMLEMVTDVDLVSAYAGEVEGVPKYRMFLSNSASKMYQLLVSPRVRVYTCLVRLYRREVIENIDIKRDDFLAVLEIMVKSVLKGYRVKELPATLGNREFGESSMNTFKIIGSHLNFMKNVVLHRTFGRKL
jgi:dolichol-phosphate mannosyltransferase